MSERALFVHQLTFLTDHKASACMVFERKQVPTARPNPIPTAAILTNHNRVSINSPFS